MWASDENTGSGTGATMFTSLNDTPNSIPPFGQLAGSRDGGELVFTPDTFVIDWYDSNNQKPYTDGVVDTTTVSYTFGGRPVAEGQTVIMGFGDSKLDFGVWVLGSMSNPAAVPVTRHPSFPLGTIFNFTKPIVCRNTGTVPDSVNSRIPLVIDNWGTDYNEIVPSAPVLGTDWMETFFYAATGLHSKALGASSTAAGDDSFAWGERAIASGYGSTTLGGMSRATGDGSFAAGRGSTASGARSIALGNTSTAGGVSSTTIGANSEAAGENAIAVGASSVASGAGSTAIGVGSAASGTSAVAMGELSLAEGSQSTAIGQKSQAKADFSLATGRNALAECLGQTAHGSALDTNPGAAQRAAYILLGINSGVLCADRTVTPTAINTITLHPHQIISFKGHCLAINVDSGEAKSWEFKGIVKQVSDASTTALVGAVTPTLIDSSVDFEPTLAIGVDTTLGSLQITGSVPSGNDVRFICNVDTVELRY